MKIEEVVGKIIGLALAGCTVWLLVVLCIKVTRAVL
jgi:hypothetical protein